MRVEKLQTKPPKEFVPIELKVTIQNENELLLLYHYLNVAEKFVEKNTRVRPDRPWPNTNKMKENSAHVLWSVLNFELDKWMDEGGM